MKRYTFVMHERQINTLDYVSPPREPANPQPVKVMITLASACWLVPLGLGVLALLGFVVTGYEANMEAGMIAIVLGIVGALAGVVLIVVAHALSARLDPETWTRLRRRGVVALAGIIANFPLAFVCAYVAAAFPVRVPVTVMNTGTSTLTDIRLDLLGRQKAIGELAPREQWHGSVRGASGRLAVTWVEAGERHERVYSENTDSDTFWGGVTLALKGREAVWDWDSY